MKLRKFRSNSTDLLQTVPEELRETADLSIDYPTTAARALGIHWRVNPDTLHVATPHQTEQAYATKRAVASTAAQIYDVLGLWAPVTVVARMLLQQMWKAKFEWDERAPESITLQWMTWMRELTELTKHPIPRRLVNSSKTFSLQLHGFSDASTKAYGAVVYLRAVYEDSTSSCNIVVARSRVAPVKPVTVPRLELTAAVLLARLLTSVTSDLSIPIENCYAWTDSSIVLSWLRHAPETLKTYEANRVMTILGILSRGQWRHVRGEDNPADLPSRGALTSELINSGLWWHGPPWLLLPPDEWPVTKLTFKFNGEGLKPSLSALAASTTATSEWSLWYRFSDFDKLVRVVAYSRRFINNSCRQAESKMKEINLSTEEIRTARFTILRQSQRMFFPEVLVQLQDNKPIPRAHTLSKFDVELDSYSGLIVIRGHVKKTEEHQQRPQVVMSLKSNVTKLLVSTRHKTYHHPGTSTMLSLLANDYYIPKLRNHLKQLSRNCVTCQRAYAQPTSQKMGALPPARTTPAPPFDRVGVDFAGPFLITRGNPRRPTRVKVYAVVFVCLVTRAIHLELCGDLTTEAFIACLRRFCARRGTPSHVYSDNGTNLVGAKNEIEELQQTLFSRGTRDAISNFSAKQQLQWHLSPPRAPHFGGIWEAGVKAMKTLLRKNLSAKPLRYDELETILVEVEAVLNSRPSEPFTSTDPDSTELITPGHFLIGRPLLAPPPVRVNDARKPDLLKRWAFVQRIIQDLWIKWRATHLQALNARSKWRDCHRNTQVGDLVLVKDEVLTVRSWPLGRVIRTYPGTDGHVRVVDVFCNGHTYKRATNRLVLLIAVPSSAPGGCLGPVPEREVIGTCD